MAINTVIHAVQDAAVVHAPAAVHTNPNVLHPATIIRNGNHLSEKDKAPEKLQASLSRALGSSLGWQ